MLNYIETQNLPSSVLATHAKDGVSKRYAFLPTLDIVNALRGEGFVPMRASQDRAKAENAGYQRHMLSFRSIDENSSTLSVGDTVPGVTVINSHNTASSLQVHLDLFRKVCANGLIVSDRTLAGYRMMHVGVTIDNVLSATYSLLRRLPEVSDVVARMQAKELSDSQRYHLAQLAMGLRWDADKVPFESARLLQLNRREDAQPTLWNTFNVIQENLIRGQQIPRWQRGRGVRSTMPIQSIERNVDINSHLWNMATAML